MEADRRGRRTACEARGCAATEETEIKLNDICIVRCVEFNINAIHQRQTVVRPYDPFLCRTFDSFVVIHDIEKRIARIDGILEIKVKRSAFVFSRCVEKALDVIFDMKRDEANSLRAINEIATLDSMKE